MGCFGFALKSPPFPFRYLSCSLLIFMRLSDDTLGPLHRFSTGPRSSQSPKLHLCFLFHHKSLAEKAGSAKSLYPKGLGVHIYTAPTATGRETLHRGNPSPIVKPRETVLNDSLALKNCCLRTHLLPVSGKQHGFLGHASHTHGSLGAEADANGRYL
ncbi:hypothetical protein HispidOSU_014651, partial [Sigmodon hispidus]